MTTVLLVVHLLVCFFLIVIVLIQGGKGADMGAAFGGSSQTLFGARGAATVFSKLTTIAAIVFMLTSFGLAVVQTKSTSVVTPSSEPVQQQQQQGIPQGTSGPIQGAPATPPASQGTPAAPAQSK